MKNIFAKNRFMKKLLCAILFSLIIAPCLTHIASAAFGTTATHEAPIEWTLSGDGEKLTASTGVVYYKYEMDIDVEFHAWNVYYYANPVELREGYNYSHEATVHSCARDGEIVWLTSGNGIDIYATEAGKQKLDGFVDGTGRLYSIANEHNNSYAKIDDSLAAEFMEAYAGGENRYTFDVKKLKDEPRYYLQFEDSQAMFRYCEGYIFEIYGEYYFVHFDSLDNTHFDADGNFSFRSGEVELMKLEGEMSEAVDSTLSRMKYRMSTTNFETDDNNSEMPMILFWIPYVFVGFVLPSAFLTLGLIFANVKKNSKHWYAVVISAGVWILLALILMFILIM